MVILEPGSAFQGFVGGNHIIISYFATFLLNTKNKKIFKIVKETAHFIFGDWTIEKPQKFCE